MQSVGKRPARSGFCHDGQNCRLLHASRSFDVRREFGDERRTKVYASGVGEFTQEDLVPNEPAIVTVTRGGYIKRLSPSTYKAQGRGGKGVKGMTTKEEDMVDILLSTTTHQQLLFFTSLGRVFSIQAYEIPETSRTAKGQAVQNLLELGAQERVTAVLELPSDSDDGAPGAYLVMATRGGLIKKTPRAEFNNIRRSGLKAINLKADDALEWVEMSSGDDEVMLVTKQGQAILFSEKDARAMGRTAAGVKGIKLKGDDQVVAMYVIGESQKKDTDVLVITEQGYGKRTPLSEYRQQQRSGSGIKTAKVTAKTGSVVKAAVLDTTKLDTTDLFIISEKGQVIRIDAASVSQLGRSTQGVRVMRSADASGKVATFTTFTAEK